MSDLGSGVTGDREPWEDDAREKGLNPEEISQVMDSIKRDLENMANRSPDERRMAMGIGVDPETVFSSLGVEPDVEPEVSAAMLEKKLSAMMVSKINWASKYGATSTYAKRSRYQDSMRHLNPMPLLPGGVDSVPEVGVLVDNSGSMDREKINLAFSMLRTVLKKTNISEVSLYHGDVQLNHVKESVKKLSADMLHEGGGGTDLGNVIREIAARPRRPQVLFVLTDAATPWPTRGEIKGMKIVVGLINASESDQKRVPQVFDKLVIETKTTKKLGR